MKKAKLSTALLVILAGAFRAPLISAAEAVSEVGTHESEDVKEWAKGQVDDLLESKKITPEEHARLIVAIDLAENVDVVYEVLNSVQYELTAYKEDAKADVKDMYERGMFNKAEYDRLMVAIDGAKSVEEVNSIMANINFDEEFLEAKYNAFEEIEAAYEKGQLTDDEYMSLWYDISNATTIEAVNEIMARFRAHIINPTLILNTANLSNTIAEAKTLVEANYTKDSWAIFAAALKNAMGQLVAVNGKVVDPTAPVLTSVTKTNTTNAANLPETGEKENRLMALYGMMISGLAGLFLVKKRKAEKESL
ncbi:LPXTG cell wall anchor domain-containing protein [Vagococcus fluvialis]|uniref:LPXTG cell wall anchor domain-containing protein n=1 Tax=Vagococcus fluvialis TaxID=2738 RepID=UPI00288FCDA5|nr:LPXTG cell wall anchor domain-containing protein [Vagococcus fluvialis]MDT2780747.1 LPXTG cell wall anchor domain-containing protein [Vagococcus fluvialis]